MALVSKTGANTTTAKICPPRGRDRRKEPMPDLTNGYDQLCAADVLSADRGESSLNKTNIAKTVSETDLRLRW